MHSRITGSTTGAIGAAAALTLFALPVVAHHGWSGNTGGDVELSGTVERGVSLSGPHATLQLRDADGQVWDITLAPAPRTHRAGLREDTLPDGAEITVHGQRNADASSYEVKVRRVTYNGEHYDVYPPPR